MDRSSEELVGEVAAIGIIRVMIIEDDPVWAEGIASLLQAQQDMEVAAVLHDWDRSVHEQRFDVDAALIDVGLGGDALKGLVATEQVRCLYPDCKVIMLSGMEEGTVMLDCFRAGAINYITKLNYRDAPVAIRAACRGKSSIHWSCADVLREELKVLRRKQDENMLTVAEKNILGLVQQGFTRLQIGESLYISESTVRNHMNRILKKMKVKNGKEAAELAARKGLLGAETE